jgi:hypothetical protein
VVVGAQVTKKIINNLTRKADPLDPLDPLAGGQEDQGDQGDHRIRARIADPLASPRTPWSRPGGSAWPHRRRVRTLLGRVPSRGEIVAGQVARQLELDPGVTLDELARQLGTDAADPDVWAAFGLYGGRRSEERS